MTLFRSILFAVVLFVLPATLSAQDVKISADVDKNPVAADEQFTLEVTVSTSGASARNLKMPDLGKFLILSGPNQSTSMQIINGTVTSSQSYSYVLQPREQGKFTIGPASVEVNGTAYRSNPIDITVTKAGGQKKAVAQGQGQQGEKIDIGDNLFIKAVADRNRVYQGEQILVQFKLYTRLELADVSIDKLPAMTSFWSEEFPQSNIAWAMETVNGKQYRVGTIRKTALFPTSSGNLDVQPMEMTCKVRIPRSRQSRDLFDQFFNDPFFGMARMADVKIKSNVLKIAVLPLPTNPVPESFHGAVGRFSLRADLNKRRVKTNEPITLKATISGTGNVKILEAPKLNLPTDFEQYDPKVKEEIERSGSFINGTKTFEWLIVPRYPGEKKIPAMEFSYFDASQHRYVTLKSSEFTLTVDKGSAEAAPNAAGLTKEDVRLLNQDIRFIKTSAGAFRPKNRELIDPTAALVLTLVPLAGFIALLFYRQKALAEMSDVVSFRSRKALKIAAKKLASAKVLLTANKHEEFYAEVSTAMWQYVSDKLAIDRAQLSIDNVTQQLQMKNVSPELTAQIKELLEACEFARFAPGSGEQTEKTRMYENASNIIIAAEKELVR